MDEGQSSTSAEQPQTSEGQSSASEEVGNVATAAAAALASAAVKAKVGSHFTIQCSTFMQEQYSKRTG